MTSHVRSCHTLVTNIDLTLTAGAVSKHTYGTMQAVIFFVSRGLPCKITQHGQVAVLMMGRKSHGQIECQWWFLTSHWPFDLTFPFGSLTVQCWQWPNPYGSADFGQDQYCSLVTRFGQGWAITVPHERAKGCFPWLFPVLYRLAGDGPYWYHMGGLKGAPYDLFLSPGT